MSDEDRTTGKSHNRTNSVTGVKYADDPTILMIALYGEIDPNPGVTSFYQQTLAYLKSIDPNHLHGTGGFSYLDGPSGLDTQWRGIMSDPNDDICEFEINSTGDRNTTAPEVTSYCKGINKPWFLAAWSSCTTGAGGGNLDNFGSDAAMAAHAQDMYNIASGGSPAADKSIGADFWNFGGTGGCDISLSQTPNTYAVVVNTAPGAVPVITPTPVPPPASGTINGSMIMASQNNMCLDVTDGNFTDGNRMQIWTCSNGNPNQLWTFNSNGTISTQNNKCLDVTNGNFSDGNPVQIWECNGGTNQQWNLGADGLLHAAQNNECLDVTDWNFVNGNRMQIWTCNGGAAQKWSVKMSVSAGNGASSR